MAELSIDNEDDFLIENDLESSGSDIELPHNESDEESSKENKGDEEEDNEFLKGLLTEEESKRPEFLIGANAFFYQKRKCRKKMA
jgi:nucleolar protein 14